MTDRDMIDARKDRLRREAARAAEDRAVNEQAKFEIAFEDVYGKNPNDPMLALVLTLLRDGDMDTALQVLADNLGPDKFFDAMARITGQPSDSPSVPALSPAGLQPAPQSQPAQLSSGHQSSPLAGVLIPEYLDVYDERGRKQNWAIPRDMPEATANAQGYYRFEVNGTMVYQKRASAPAAPAPAAPSGPTGTHPQPAATGGWRRRSGR